MTSDVRLFRWSSNRIEDQFLVEESATGAPLALVQGGGESEVDAAVKAAYVVYQNDWRWRGARERGRLLLEAAGTVRRHADEIATLEARENGKPIAQARMDVEACITAFEFFGGLAGRLPQEFHDFDSVYGAVFYEPYGVVGAIAPFNWPPIHAAGKTAPALAMGNTVVLKPSEFAPLCILRIVEMLQDVFPPDVLLAVPGSGAVAGNALAGHPLVSKISFTGRTETGAAVLKRCAENITPAIVELGGKNAIIVLQDADVGLALRGIVESGFYNQGEACTAGSRVLVHSSLYEEVVDRLANAVAKLRVGASLDPRTHVGPLISRAHQKRVNDYIELGVSEGARIAAQAPLPREPELKNGFFSAPTIFADVAPDMRVAREEIFGPVICVMSFENLEQALAIANDTPYGLVAGIYTKDYETAMKAARRLDVGIVFLNNNFRGAYGAPFGGAKASGYGREHCLATLREFARSKMISMPAGVAPMRGWPALDEIGLGLQPPS